MTDAYVACRSRIGAARLVLEALPEGSPELQSLSALQTNALATLLRRDQTQAFLSKDQKASLSAMLVKIKWAPEHLALCLAALQGKDSVCSNRRAQQDFVAFLNYVSLYEWKHVEKSCHDFQIVCQILLEVLVDRLNCINPTEATKKFLATTLTYIENQSQGASADYGQKGSMLEYVKKVYRTRTKRAHRIGLHVAPKDYIIHLPENPEDLLLGEFSHLYAKFKIDGCWTPCPLRMLEVHCLDASYGCRGIPRASSGGADLVNQIGTMLKAIQQGKSDGGAGDEVPIRLCTKKRFALPPPGLELKRSKSNIFDRFEGGSSISSLIDSDESPQKDSLDHPCDDMSSALVPCETPRTPSTSGASLALRNSAALGMLPPTQPLGRLLVGQIGEPSDAESPRSRGDELLDAMLAKQKEAAAFRRIELRKEKAILAAKKELDSDKRREMGVASKVVEAAAVAGGVSEVIEVTAATAVAGGTSEASVAGAKDVEKKKRIDGPTIHHERSRTQFQCRTGFKGKGQNHAKKYGEGCAYATMEEAREAAQKWLNEQLAL